MANGADVFKHFAAVAAAVLFSALALTGAGLAGAAASATSGSSGDVLALLNAERLAAGLPALREAPDLTAAAQLRAESMARAGTLEHTRSLTRVVVPGDGLGENVGYAASPQDVNREFMASSSHRSAILSSSYDEVGVGVVPAGGVIWVTEIFRNAAPPGPPKRAADPDKKAPVPEGKAPAAAPSAAVPVPVPVSVPMPVSVPEPVAVLPVPPVSTSAPRVTAVPTARTSAAGITSAAPKAPTGAETENLDPQAIATSAPDVPLRVAATALGMVAALCTLLPARLDPFRRRRPHSRA